MAVAYQPLFCSIGGKRFPVVFAYPASISAEPEISRFIFQDAHDTVIGQPLCRRIGGKGFPIVFAYPPSIRAEP